jgi:hypothetical protein
MICVPKIGKDKSKKSKEEKKKEEKADDARAGADVGKIVNLMAGDANRVIPLLLLSLPVPDREYLL